MSKKIKVDFYGPGNTKYQQIIKNLGLGHIVTFHPRVSKNEILQKLFNADLSLLIHGFSKLTASSTSTKLFEYMATGKPILAIMPESEASEILKNHPNTCIVTNPNTQKAIAFLAERFKKWEQNEPFHIRKIDYEFNRKGQANQLANIFNQIV